jgi:hypothetical protein
MTVSELPDRLVLLSDTQDIEDALGSIGRLSEIEDVGCLFVETAHGAYRQVWACSQSTPHLRTATWRLY